MNTINITPFDVAECLTDEATINAYLNEVLENGVPSELVQALNDIVKARGMNDIANNRQA